MKNIILAFACLTTLGTADLYASNSPRDTIPSLDEDTAISMNFDENLDSLLNLYYVGQSVASDPEFWNNVNDSSVPDFPDSVYIDRLKKIPTVVDLTYNSVVRRYIEVYTKEKRGSVGVMLGLSQYYFPLFDDIFDYYDIPNEMKYMSIIESALNPRAYSRTRAVGLWQFMFGTGRLYGLTVNSLVDDRRDPIKSTYAAARFVKDLYSIYNDWILVIAAYNCGPGNVNKAIRRSGGKRNYWDIYYYLPRETRGHVPAFIAATYVMNYYKEHNLKPVPISFPLASDTIIVRKDLHMAQVSEVLGIPQGSVRTRLLRADCSLQRLRWPSPAGQLGRGGCRQLALLHPEFDLEAWHQSEKTILAWGPDTLFLTHFGPYHGASQHMQAMFENIDAWSGIVRRLLADAAIDDGERQRRFRDPAANGAPERGQRGDVAHVQGVELPIDLLGQPVLLQMGPEGLGRQREAVRHADSGRAQGAHQFTKRRVLAPDIRDILEREIGKTADEPAGNGTRTRRGAGLAGDRRSGHGRTSYGGYRKLVGGP